MESFIEAPMWLRRLGSAHSLIGDDLLCALYTRSRDVHVTCCEMLEGFIPNVETSGLSRKSFRDTNTLESMSCRIL